MIYLYGAGGHAKVIAEILELCGKKVQATFDDDPSKFIWNIPALQYPGPFDATKDELILSIGDNFIRKKISMKLNVNYCSATHPASVISKCATTGYGTVIMGGVLINADTNIGKHCIVNSSASIDHDCMLEDYVHISPNATLCGGVHISECCHIGAGAIVIPNVKIGENTIVGAGAVVVNHLPANVTAVGNPARIIKKNA